MTAKAERICSVCKNKNAIDAAQCLYCGASFLKERQRADTTLAVARFSDASAKISAHLKYLAALPANMLALFIMGDEQPLLLRYAGEVVLGRGVTDTPPILYDLSRYGAADLGVSRRHALLTFNDGVCALTDLGSTNGTWVSEVRLAIKKPHRVRSSDWIRLGSLYMFAYFREGHETSQGVEVVISLVEEPRPESLPRSRITAEYLNLTLQPYLQALTDLQNVIAESREQLPAEVVINMISTFRPDKPISVSLGGASEAVWILKTLLLPWRQAQSKELSLIGSAREQIVTQLTVELERLAAKVAGDIAPELPEAQQKNLAGKILPALTVLATSRLQVTLE